MKWKKYCVFACIFGFLFVIMEVHYISGRFKTKLQTGHVPMTLVLGYMRSGSSLTADIIRVNHGDFYIFEPLHGLIEFSVKQNRSISFLNGTEQRLSYNDTVIEKLKTEMMLNWFTCNFQDIDLNSLYNEFIHIYTPEHDLYFNCTRQDRSNDSSLAMNIAPCISILQKACVEANSRMYKTIRLHTASVGYLLKRLPSLKVIHLVRDPRAILHSQLIGNLTQSNRNHFRSFSRLFCGKMLEDIRNVKLLTVKYQGRIQRLVYENLALNPIEVSKSIYNFLRAQFTIKVKEYVDSLTTGPIVRCEYCTRRGNSTYNAFKWMQNITSMYLHIIDKNCREVYREVGYSGNISLYNESWNPNIYQLKATL